MNVTGSFRASINGIKQENKNSTNDVTLAFVARCIGPYMGCASFRAPYGSIWNTMADPYKILGIIRKSYFLSHESRMWCVAVKHLLIFKDK